MHISQLHKHVEKGEFSIKFISEKGEVISIDKAICTSFHSKGNTMNVKILISKQVRTIRRCTIVEFNGQEVWL